MTNFIKYNGRIMTVKNVIKLKAEWGDKVKTEKKVDEVVKKATTETNKEVVTETLLDKAKKLLKIN